MSPFSHSILFISLLLPATPTGTPEQPATPADEFKALLKQYQTVASAGKILTDAERMEHIGRVYKHHDRIALQFVELAEKYPKDPVAVDALMQAIWQVNTTPWPVEIVGNDTAWLRAFTLLERDHIRSDKLGPACTRLSWGFRKEYGPFLRAVLENNPHKAVQAQASLALAHYLHNRAHRLDLLRENATAAKEFADLYGKEYLEDLFKQDHAKVLKEVEALLERAAKDFADVKLPAGGTAGASAKAELFELRHLSVGKEAPDIEGKDQHGKSFKLSDYRGKVVLLDFWSEY